MKLLKFLRVNYRNRKAFLIALWEHKKRVRVSLASREQMRPIVWRGTVTRAISRAQSLRNLIKDAAAVDGFDFILFIHEANDRAL